MEQGNKRSSIELDDDCLETEEDKMPQKQVLIVRKPTQTKKSRFSMKDLEEKPKTASSSDTENNNMKTSLKAIGVENLDKNYRASLDGYIPIPEDNKDPKEEIAVRFSLRKLLNFAPKFYFDSIPLILAVIYPAFMNLFTIYWLSFFYDATLSAGFGLSNALYLFFYMVPVQVSNETTG